ncbi:MAG: cation/H(+) antiporter [Chloroflexi bacterium]|nr:MAG: cation/H(+) antiporter [Chloroflexota bacterium]
MLAVARLLGEMAMALHQPAVLGEILAGIVLGPTILGALAPAVEETLFPIGQPPHTILNGLTTVSVVLFLLVAGTKVNLSSIWRQGRAAFNVSIAGIAFPFALGFASAWFLPSLLGSGVRTHYLPFALFFATALSISALPVIAKTLMDLGLYHTDLGMVVIAAAIFDDLIGWIIFAVILGMMDARTQPTLAIGQTIALTLTFAALMLSAGRWGLNRILPWLQGRMRGAGGVLGFGLPLALFAAAFTAWIGIHAIFGAFLVGVALGDSPHLNERARATMSEFVSSFFAPLFFASIGLRINFLAHFDGVLVLTVLLIACVGKVVGCGLAAQGSGMARVDAWAVGVAMNSRGAMEIILGLMALQYGIIEERMFVALVVMALVTSAMSGPLMRALLAHRGIASQRVL